MLELFEDNPGIRVLESEYKRLLGYPPNHEIGERGLELMAWAESWYAEHGRPWVYGRLSHGLEIRDDKFLVEGVAFSSSRVDEKFSVSKADQAILAAVSAGKECEMYARKLWAEGKPDEYFFLEIYGSAVVEFLITNIGGRFCEWADMQSFAMLPHYSPGYPEWGIEQQQELCRLIFQETNQDLRSKISVMETGMLNPKKSLLAIFGVTRHIENTNRLENLVPCENCSLMGCDYRRAPYKHTIRQLENVSQLQSVFVSGDHEMKLEINADYTTGKKALNRWAVERLELCFVDDNCIKAKFHYEGTTCSNMGHRLQYIYQIELSGSQDGYKIRSMECNPAEGDDGFTYMCEYLNDADVLEESIRSEKPLLGKSLNDIFTWKRDVDFSGCYCDKSSRDHKWGLALEVLHYALVQRQIELTNDQDESNINYTRADIL